MGREEKSVILELIDVTDLASAIEGPTDSVRPRP